MKTLTLIIPANSTTSNQIDLEDMIPVSLATPSALTGTSLTVNGAVRNNEDAVAANYCDGYSNTEVKIPVVASKVLAFTGDLAVALTGLRSLQVVSSATEAAVRVFALLVREV